ncbi:MAG: hypothetical protein NZX77_17850, partial [Polyangiaceae bacterium]|nr:hypothetical protein [Polyangiaceae bacterium]
MLLRGLLPLSFVLLLGACGSDEDVVHASLRTAQGGSGGDVSRGQAGSIGVGIGQAGFAGTSSGGIQPGGAG